MSRIDMMAPSTTTPATRSTSLSSLPDAAPGGTDAGCGGVWVVTRSRVRSSGTAVHLNTHRTDVRPVTLRTSQARTDSIALATRGSSGTTWGLNRATTAPEPSTMNFSKFHMMSPVLPDSSGVPTSSSYTGWRPGPFTSTFSVIGNVTP